MNEVDLKQLQESIPDIYKSFHNEIEQAHDRSSKVPLTVGGFVYVE